LSQYFPILTIPIFWCCCWCSSVVRRLPSHLLPFTPALISAGFLAALLQSASPLLPRPPNHRVAEGWSRERGLCVSQEEGQWAIELHLNLRWLQGWMGEIFNSHIAPIEKAKEKYRRDVSCACVMCCRLRAACSKKWAVARPPLALWPLVSGGKSSSQVSQQAPGLMSHAASCPEVS
jgi:hypothetical protein